MARCLLKNLYRQHRTRRVSSRGRWQSKARHNAMRKWYNSLVARATKRPHRSGTGNGEADSCPLVWNERFHLPLAHPAIAQTALHNSKHDVQMKYWSYFTKVNDMIASCASHLGRHLVSMFSPLGLTRASFECMEKGSCAPLSCSQDGLGSWSAHTSWR